MNHLGDTNKMVSDTPRTNQVSIRPQYGDEWDWCRADFARQLERELNEANKTIRLQHELMTTAEKRGVDKAKEELNEANERIKLLKSSGDELLEWLKDGAISDSNYRLLANSWQRAKENKR